MIKLLYADLQKDLIHILNKINKAEKIVDEESEILELKNAIQKLYIEIHKKRTSLN